MKLLKFITILLIFYLLLSTEASKITNNKFITKLTNKKNSGTKKGFFPQCQDGWKYFFGGLFFNAGADLVQKSGLFKDTNVERCFENVANTVWNFMENYKKK